jgi:hypothetical protein
MKRKALLPMTAALVMLPIIRLPKAHAQEAPTKAAVSRQSPLARKYAEGLYAQYEGAASGKISFSVQTVADGCIADLAGLPFSGLVTVPSYRIVSDQFGTSLSGPRFVLPESSSDGPSDTSDNEHPSDGPSDTSDTSGMGETVDKFAANGFPLEDGQYRRLLVTATIGDDVRSHEAIEFCWTPLNHCEVLDPVVVFME